MSGPLTILDDQTAAKRSGEVFVYEFDYDEHLAVGVELASVGTFTLDPTDGQLTTDNPALVSGNRAATLRLSGGKVGKTYSIEHAVTTNETPSQTLKKRFYLFIRP